MEEYPVKVTTEEFETCIHTHAFLGIPLKSHRRLILLTALSAQLSFARTNPIDGLQAPRQTCASSREGQTSVHTGAEPQPVIVRSCMHGAQAAGQQEAAGLRIQVRFLQILVQIP